MAETAIGGTATADLDEPLTPEAKKTILGATVGFFVDMYDVYLPGAALMLYLTPVKGGVNSPYVQFGWRVPFVVGALIAFGFALWFRRVPESRSWLESDKTENPIGTLFSGKSRKAFLQVFLVMSGFWLSLNATISTLPQVLTKTAGMSSTTVTPVLLIANVVQVGGYLFFGVIGQRLGRP